MSTARLAPSQSTVRVAGALFLTAMFSSLGGGMLLQGLIDHPSFPASLAADTGTVMTGVLLELVNAMSVIGIAMMLRDHLGRHSEVLAHGYVSLRLIEAMICFAAAVVPLALTALGGFDAGLYPAMTHTLVATRDYLFSPLLPVFFCANAFLLYYALWRWRLTPRWLSGWGFVATVMILALNAFPAALDGAAMLLALPIILQEITMGIWFIAKGLAREPTPPFVERAA